MAKLIIIVALLGFGVVGSSAEEVASEICTRR